MTLPPEKNEGHGPHIQIRPAGYQSGRCEAIFSPVQKLSEFPSSQAFEKHPDYRNNNSSVQFRLRAMHFRQKRGLQIPIRKAQHRTAPNHDSLYSSLSHTARTASVPGYRTFGKA